MRYRVTTQGEKIKKSLDVFLHFHFLFCNFAASWSTLLSALDLGRSALFPKSANFIMYEAQRQPALWAASLCVHERFAERRKRMVGSPLFHAFFPIVIE